jgi:murein tripeptide amidase MpaA
VLKSKKITSLLKITCDKTRMLVKVQNSIMIKSINTSKLIRVAEVLGITMFLSLVLIGQSESVNIPEKWKTLAEKSNYQKTWRYEETIKFAESLDKESDLIHYKSFGKSGEGRNLPLLIASKDRAFTPEIAHKQGKAVILIQAGIHAGEIDGKDAGLALLRDIAITKTRIDLLQNAVILFVPVYNVDGHENWSAFNRINQNGPEETGTRANSTNLNLNRDYMKADSPETRAFLRLWDEWKPDFFFDLHVTDGADFRYNLTYEYAHFGDAHPAVLAWMNKNFEKNVVEKVEKEGNILTHYLEFGGREVTSGIFTFIPTPRFATGYTPLRNRAGLLIETHVYKTYKSRVRGTYDVLRYTIEEIGRNKSSLFEANNKADNDTVERGKTYDPNRKFPLKFELTDKSEPFQLKGVEYKFEDSEISGGKRLVYGTKPLDITVKKFDEAKVTASVAPPLYYIIPPQWTAAIQVLQLHGIKIRRLKQPLELEVESYRLNEPKWAANSFENRITLGFKTTPITEKRLFPKDSLIVPMSQESANVAIHLLEPDSPDSLMFWGFFNSIFEQKEYGESYVIEKLAAEMLAKDANLQKEFAEKLKDEKFAKSPSARLRFFYERSPYARERIGYYPVGRIIKNIDVKLFR